MPVEMTKGEQDLSLASRIKKDLYDHRIEAFLDEALDSGDMVRASRSVCYQARAFSRHGRAIAAYADRHPEVPLSPVISRWAEEDEKLLSSSLAAPLIRVRALADYCEACERLATEAQEIAG